MTSWIVITDELDFMSSPGGIQSNNSVQIAESISSYEEVISAIEINNPSRIELQLKMWKRRDETFSQFDVRLAAEGIKLDFELRIDQQRGIYNDVEVLKTVLKDLHTGKVINIKDYKENASHDVSKQDQCS